MGFVAPDQDALEQARDQALGTIPSPLSPQHPLANNASRPQRVLVQ